MSSAADDERQGERRRAVHPEELEGERAPRRGQQAGRREDWCSRTRCRWSSTATSSSCASSTTSRWTARRSSSSPTRASEWSRASAVEQVHRGGRGVLRRADAPRRPPAPHRDAAPTRRAAAAAPRPPPRADRASSLSPDGPCPPPPPPPSVTAAAAAIRRTSQPPCTPSPRTVPEASPRLDSGAPLPRAAAADGRRSHRRAAALQGARSWTCATRSTTQLGPGPAGHRLQGPAQRAGPGRVREGAQGHLRLLLVPAARRGDQAAQARAVRAGAGAPPRRGAACSTRTPTWRGPTT